MIGIDFPNCFNCGWTIALRHTVVHHDEFVGHLIGPNPILNSLDSLLTIVTEVALLATLLHQTLHGIDIEGAVIDHKNSIWLIGLTGRLLFALKRVLQVDY